MDKRYQAKVAELRTFFESRKPGVAVCTDWDSDLRAVSFRFDGAGDKVPVRLLKISEEVLDDQASGDIIAGLEARNWDEILSGAPAGARVIYTRAGFRLTP